MADTRDGSREAGGAKGPESRERSTLLLAAAGLAILALLAAGLWLAPRVTRSSLEALARGSGTWGPLVLLGAQAAQIVLAPIPGVLVPLLAGLLYGPFLGSAVTAGGTLAGSAIAYALGRRAGRPLLERWIGAAKIAKADSLLAGKRWLALVPLFLVPFSPSDALCFAAGIAGLTPGHFLLAVALGRFPKDVLWCLAGAGLLRIGR